MEEIIMNIDGILNPVALQDFQAENWESELLHINRSDSDYFNNLVSVAQIKRLVRTSDVYFPDVQVVDFRTQIAASKYTADDKRIIPERLLHHHKQGATVIVSQAQNKFQTLAQLCKAVTKQFQIRCQANVYLSPAGNQGFHSHYDTHDVFILQVSGCKTFRFFRSDIELPFPDDTYHPDNNSAGDALAEARLSAGDTLYIPRGMVHDALADESGPSLHITLGVFPFVVRDLLQQMIQVAAEQNVSLRRGLQTVALSGDELEEHLNQVLLADIQAEALSRLADQMATDSAPDNTVIVPTIDLNSTLTVNESAVLNIERRDEQIKLRLDGQVLQFSEPMSTAVEAMLANYSLRVDALPGLDNEQKLALAGHLARASVVVVSNE